MNHIPRTRTVVSCVVLVTALGAGITACGSDGDPLSATPYDAAGLISFNAPTQVGERADPDKPLEISVKDEGASPT